MNKSHNQQLEEQIKALSIENKRLKEKESDHEETLWAVERLSQELKELEEDRDIQTWILNKTIDKLTSEKYNKTLELKRKISKYRKEMIILEIRNLDYKKADLIRNIFWSFIIIITAIWFYTGNLTINFH